MCTYLLVQGGNNVGEPGLSGDTVRCVLLKGVLSDSPPRAVELVQTRHNVLQEREKGRMGF